MCFDRRERFNCNVHTYIPLNVISSHFFPTSSLCINMSHSMTANDFEALALN